MTQPNRDEEYARIAYLAYCGQWGESRAEFKALPWRVKESWAASANAVLVRAEDIKRLERMAAAEDATGVNGVNIGRPRMPMPDYGVNAKGQPNHPLAADFPAYDLSPIGEHSNYDQSKP